MSHATKSATKQDERAPALARVEGSGLLEILESMARQNCHTGKVERDYNGQVAGTLVTDSGAISANASALESLAEHGRFRIVAAMGRMVVGYWPENDPNNKVRQAPAGALSVPSGSALSEI